MYKFDLFLITDVFLLLDLPTKKEKKKALYAVINRLPSIYAQTFGVICTMFLNNDENDNNKKSVRNNNNNNKINININNNNSGLASTQTTTVVSL